jgi:hypothetical protein
MWVHYNNSPKPVIIKDVAQADHHKPCGLWITPHGQEDNWIDWCITEDFHVNRYTNAHEVIFSPTANLLTMSTPQELDSFTDEYGIDLATSTRLKLNGKYNHTCDWERVAEKWDGILITPYIWERRRTMWYYSWDCASGCIWRASAIEKITLRPELADPPVRA